MKLLDIYLKMKTLFVVWRVVTFEQAGTDFITEYIFRNKAEADLNSINPNPTVVAIFKLQTIPFVFTFHITAYQRSQNCICPNEKMYLSKLKTVFV